MLTVSSLAMVELLLGIRIVVNIKHESNSTQVNDHGETQNIHITIALTAASIKAWAAQLRSPETLRKKKNPPNLHKNDQYHPPYEDSTKIATISSVGFTNVS
jgi:hypothetical protein